MGVFWRFTSRFIFLSGFTNTLTLCIRLKALLLKKVKSLSSAWKRYLEKELKLNERGLAPATRCAPSGISQLADGKKDWSRKLNENLPRKAKLTFSSRRSDLCISNTWPLTAKLTNRAWLRVPLAQATWREAPGSTILRMSARGFN